VPAWVGAMPTSAALRLPPRTHRGRGRGGVAWLARSNGSLLIALAPMLADQGPGRRPAGQVAAATRSTHRKPYTELEPQPSSGLPPGLVPALHWVPSRRRLAHFILTGLTVEAQSRSGVRGPEQSSATLAQATPLDSSRRGKGAVVRVAGTRLGSATADSTRLRPTGEPSAEAEVEPDQRDAPHQTTSADQAR
jgi:hypothetical protein